MSKSTVAKIVGFTAAVGTTAALVGFAASGTGAYFTDSHDGRIAASTGTVKVGVSPADLKLDFTGLLPGTYTDKTVSYQNQGSGNEDVWLVFPNDSSNGFGAEAFVGSPDDGDPDGNGDAGGLGRYGHFALSSTGGAHFTSYNLNNPTSGSTDTCSINDNGWGGSNAQPTSPSDTSVPFCAPANAILLSSNVAPGDGGTATLTFGFTPLLTSQTQYAALTKIVSYQIVATQHGVRPDNPFNG
jgi:hypothetical protein